MALRFDIGKAKADPGGNILDGPQHGGAGNIDVAGQSSLPGNTPLIAMDAALPRR